MRAKLVREAMEFKRGRGTARSLGIGEEAIKAFIDQYIPSYYNNYTITDDLKVDIPLGLIIEQEELWDPPVYVKYNLLPYLGFKTLNKLPWSLIEHCINEENLVGHQKSAYLLHKLYNLTVKEERSEKDPDVTKILSQLKHEFDEKVLLSKEAKDIFGNTDKNEDQILLNLIKAFREEEEENEEELFGYYVFIGRPDFKEIERGGEILHKKELEIENLYQLDRYNKSDLLAVNMMKMRARVQGEGSEFYGVYIPRFMHDQKTTMNSEISDKLRKYIEENKFKL